MKAGMAELRTLKAKIIFLSFPYTFLSRILLIAASKKNRCQFDPNNWLQKFMAYSAEQLPGPMQNPLRSSWWDIYLYFDCCTEHVLS